MTPLTIDQVNDHVYQVFDNQGAHVGNLKWIQGLWKFKAIGYDALGEVIPGGGPLTDRHNTVFGTLDLTELSARLSVG